jgi:hypothetical protein
MRLPHVCTIQKSTAGTADSYGETPPGWSTDQASVACRFYYSSPGERYPRDVSGITTADALMLMLPPSAIALLGGDLALLGGDLALSLWPTYEATVSDGLVLETTATAPHFVDREIAVTAGTDYTLSALLAAQERTYACLHAIGETVTAWAYFDLVAGTVGAHSADATDPQCTPVDGGFRCSFGVNSGADTTLGIGVAPATDDTDCWSDEYAGDITKGIYSSIPVLEIGAPTFPTAGEYRVVTTQAGYAGTYAVDAIRVRTNGPGAIHHYEVALREVPA